ncbi:hypothetical protein [Pelomonas sp. Root1444]|uniref:hypothetical protein n=1 Tax=Pelomonas sp. Root1444 TaxID=1736464 RepID=UPI0007032DE3|nr:hypothetical protein [Pelomonas sp. Root1444]KQY83654.1 hypothetical protein ASD35_24325 [Pelomonas sp. Root1444]
MPFDDDLAGMLQDAGEPMTLAGAPLHGLFDVDGQVMLEGGVTSTTTTATVLASVGAQRNQTLVRQGVSYLVRQVLPEPPDGALHLLVLAKA